MCAVLRTRWHEACNKSGFVRLLGNDTFKLRWVRCKGHKIASFCRNLGNKVSVLGTILNGKQNLSAQQILELEVGIRVVSLTWTVCPFRSFEVSRCKMNYSSFDDLRKKTLVPYL